MKVGTIHNILVMRKTCRCYLAFLNAMRRTGATVIQDARSGKLISISSEMRHARFIITAMALWSK